MKILDEKGKLFGIVNIFDLLILFLIISFILLAVKWSRVAEDPSWIRVKTFFMPCIGITITPRYVADHIKEGDEMLNDDGLVVARIIKIISNEPAQPPPPPLPKPKPNIYLSEDGEKISIKSGIIVISSKSGEKLFRQLEPEVEPEPEVKVEPKPKKEDESRKITMIIDILSYDKKGEVNSCITYQPLKIAKDFLIQSHKKFYSFQVNIRDILIEERKDAGETEIGRAL